MSGSLKITGFRSVAELDECPDLSYLGEYSDTPAEKFSIDREERGDYRGREYKYFNAENVEDDAQALQNYERMEGSNNGDWCMYGIRAECVVEVSHDAGRTWTRHKMRSAGIWGIESDSSDDYKREIADDEIDNLKADLYAMGILDETINAGIEEHARVPVEA